VSPPINSLTKEMHARWLLLLALIVCKQVSSLSLIASVEGVNVSLFQQPIQITTLVQQTCASKAAVLQGKDVTLVNLNYTVLDFMKNSNEYPSIDSNSNFSQALFYDVSQHKDFVSYYEDLGDSVALRGFDAIVVRGEVNQDLSYLSWLTLRFYKRKQCSAPVFLILDDRVGQAFQNFSKLLVRLDYEENWVSRFVRTPGYIIGVSIPSYTVAILLFGTSAFKLYHSGFPRVFNSGITLCLLGLSLAIVICKFLSSLLNADLFH
jgi:hypothetical protein